jgi:hypothetical protein
VGKILFNPIKIIKMGKNQHVTKNRSGGWNVKGAGNSKATVVKDTQKQAIDAAITIAKNQKSEVVIHGVNNKIRDKDSYGNDPVPPIDKKN